MIAEFNENNPWASPLKGRQGGYGDIYTKMIAGIPTGDVPSLVVAYQNQALAYHQAGGLVDNLDDYVLDPTWGLNEAEIADFVPSFFQQDVSEDGIRIGFPPNRSLEGLYYNQTALEELGYDGPPTTWEEFREMACAFTEQGWSYTATTRSAHRSYRRLEYRADMSLMAAISTPTPYDYTGQATVDYIQFMADLYNDAARPRSRAVWRSEQLTAGKALFFGPTRPALRCAGHEDAFETPSSGA